MKKFTKLMITLCLFMVAFLIAVDFYIAHMNFSGTSKVYKVSVNRIEKAIDSYEAEHGKGMESLPNIGDYDQIVGITMVSRKGIELEAAMTSLLEKPEYSYEVYVTNMACYRIDYKVGVIYKWKIILTIDVITFVLFAMVILLMLYVRQKILKPFATFSNLPYELSKGNLTIPLKENKNRYFGRFVWGMDMLRENIEDSKEKELELVKEKKLLLMSLSHDIKSPLSAIKLYAKAYERNLYKTEEKRQEIAASINKNVDEIEAYVSEIVKASNDDFLEFEVKDEEFYIKPILEKIRAYYDEKMSLNQIDFSISEYNNNMIKGDEDRVVEVLQNAIENAIKYGDGKRIYLDVTKDEDALVIAVNNTGCTLPDSELAHVCDSFFRGSNVGDRPGSGLGLYICRKLMHMMDGEIITSVKNHGDSRIMEVKFLFRLV